MTVKNEYLTYKDISKGIPVGKIALFTFQQHHHVPPWLVCLTQVMYFFIFAPSDEKLGYDY